jgi:AcrR family transcriptional regulator
MQFSCIDAVILQQMDEAVKTDRRALRRAETERRLVEAATQLFTERGYAVTTLADIAAHADLAPRTLYLHFATKAELLLTCVQQAIVGDAEPVPLADRPAMGETMTAPTLDERLRLMASLTASLMERTGPLLEVAFQAAPAEPSVAAAAAAGRAATRQTLQEFWRRADEDGLLPPSTDLEWLTETAILLTHADTYLLIRRTAGWSIDTYRSWLHTTWRRLVSSSAQVERPGADGEGPGR